MNLYEPMPGEVYMVYQAAAGSCVDVCGS